MDRGEQSIRGYELKEKLGAGAFGEVYKGRKNGNTYAIKKIPIGFREERAKIEKEVTSLKHLQDENVVRFIDSFDANDSVFIVLEFCNGGDLNSYILRNRSTSTADRLGFVNQLAKGVKYLHANKIVHRDIKPDNIMINNNGIIFDNLVIKIADFGLSRVWEAFNYQSPYYNFQYSPKGPPYYTAPEVYHDNVTMKSDIFSMGCVIMALFAGTTITWIGGKQLLAPYIGSAASAKKQISEATEDEKLANVRRYIQIQANQKAFQDLVYDMVQKNWRDRPNADKAYQRAYDIVAGESWCSIM
ncbi:serine/threonine-protein kinase pdik1l-B [Patella vulgata]|uniref:serine/threonine-protein kinase pdik1l-B n=1 Tax=Patella vulgata TaxID=6465 RepID=UPI0024A8F78F|nr:serine/threonine-protein kinase pdik1l-B [Patella vulgata]